MAKASAFGMAFHQTLGFSGLMMKIPKAEAVFWPGCALLNLDGIILEKTLEVLRREEPGMELAAACCGQPSVYLFPEKAGKRKEKIASQLKKQGVKRIYTACPNCTLQLRELGEFAIIPVWPVLARQIRREDLAGAAGSFVWHDPCPTRKEPDQQKGARALLEMAGCQYCEPDHTGSCTQCCGNFHMMAATAPEKSRQLRLARLAEFPPECTVASNCQGCLGAFRSEGRDTCHLLEILFGRSQSQGWGNRIKTTWK